MFVSFAGSQNLKGETGKQAYNKQHLLADVQNVPAEHEMFEKFGAGETGKQGQAVETISCQANIAGQYRQAFRANLYSFLEFLRNRSVTKGKVQIFRIGVFGILFLQFRLFHSWNVVMVFFQNSESPVPFKLE